MTTLVGLTKQILREMDAYGPTILEATQLPRGTPMDQSQNPYRHLRFVKVPPTFLDATIVALRKMGMAVPEGLRDEQVARIPNNPAEPIQWPTPDPPPEP